MIPSVLCYVPPSVELLGPTPSPSFQTQINEPQISNQIYIFEEAYKDYI